ncbi:MAG TPA: bifunctional UDP-N-acetylglucosamine diphosphorylase/glucosamine-1-phosphate N-acetyltransferase GlmU, partial [Propioniciclava tarda]|nr:bifunctional UDP-N-acetylglucosamine diphosphorylase/glucosamine-1-phosphate N-acetyltransferase GlmU [Propioniciclava tarda]
AKAQGGHVHPMVLDDPWEAEGVNDRSQLATLGRIKNQRICESWMRNGVTIIDPATTWIEDGVDIATDVTLLPGTQLEGATTIHAGAVIGPDTTLRDAEVGQDAKVVRTHGLLATIGDRASVGPFVHLRPGTEIEADARVAAFVDLRDAHISEGERVAPLSAVDGHVV